MQAMVWHGMALCHKEVATGRSCPLNTHAMGQAGESAELCRSLTAPALGQQRLHIHAWIT